MLLPEMPDSRYLWCVTVNSARSGVALCAFPVLHPVSSALVDDLRTDSERSSFVSFA